MRDALDTWWKKADGRATIDYGLHMIVTDLPDAGLEDMDALVGEGVASFKLFMAYPGVLMVDDATIFKALPAPPKTAPSSACTRKTAASSMSSSSVHADEGAVFGGAGESLENRGVVHHQHAGISHEKLETGDSFADPGVVSSSPASGRSVTIMCRP